MKKKAGDIMPIIIERIIDFEKSDAKAFMVNQDDELKRLLEMKRRKDSGEDIDNSGIIRLLQEAGILGSDGKLSAFYTDGE